MHDKHSDDAPFIEGLRLIEGGAADDRHFVKKTVNMALRAIGKRNALLNTAAVEVAQRVANSVEPAPRWVGKDALREFTGAAVARRLASRRRTL